MNIKTKAISLIMAGTVMLSLCSCGSIMKLPADMPPGAEENTPSDNLPADGLTASADIYKEPRMEAYQLALQRFMFEHVWPDGSDTGFDGEYGFIEKNCFAICDVDCDGVDELLLQLKTAPPSKQTEAVFGYDAGTGTVYRKLAVYPDVNYYSNGLVQANAPYDATVAEQCFWPYTLYHYDTESCGYTVLAQVEAANDGTMEVSCDGNASSMSAAEYEARLAQILGDAALQEIPYQLMEQVLVE